MQQKAQKAQKHKNPNKWLFSSQMFFMYIFYFCLSVSVFYFFVRVKFVNKEV